MSDKMNFREWSYKVIKEDIYVVVFGFLYGYFM